MHGTSRGLLLSPVAPLSALLLVACGNDGASDHDGATDAATDRGAEGPDSGGNGDSGTTGDASVIQQGTRIVLSDGVIQGAVEGGARHFFAIPYAKPPVGDLRFRAPVDNDPWTRVLDATELPGRCAQPDSLTSGQGTDNEDCLYLNVWAPEPAPAEPLPVLVWIHGGGNQSGSTADLLPIIGERLFYNGQSFAENHDVVVVSMNYRLGVFGYLAHPELTQEGEPSGNQGLFDQRLALEWVQDNIAAFGGDPGNVTIFGESAGARNVCFHVVSPGSRGLFHRAISESGDCTAFRWPTRSDIEDQASAFADAVGCGDAESVLACLRDKAPSDLIIDAPLAGAVEDPAPGGARYSGGTPAWEFGPVIDGDFVPEAPRDLFASGDVAQVPYLMGTNTEEGALFHLTAPVVETEEQFQVALERAFGDSAGDIGAVYSVADFPSPNDALVRVTTDSRYACAVQDLADRATAAGLDVYAYNFDLPYAIPGLETLGKAHGAELPFVFASLGPDQWPEGNKAVSDLMEGYWARFGATGDPNGGDAPEWPRFSPDQGNRLDLGLEPVVVTDFRAERCAVWKQYYATLQ